MNIVEGTALQAPSEDRLQWFEESYGVILPNEFRDLLNRGNGAQVEPNTFWLVTTNTL